MIGKGADFGEKLAVARNGSKIAFCRVADIAAFGAGELDRKISFLNPHCKQPEQLINFIRLIVTTLLMDSVTTPAPLRLVNRGNELDRNALAEEILGNRQEVIDIILIAFFGKVACTVVFLTSARFAGHGHRVVRTVGEKNNRIDTAVFEGFEQEILRVFIPAEVVFKLLCLFVVIIKAFGVVPIVCDPVVLGVNTAADVVAVDIQPETVFAEKLFG